MQVNVERGKCISCFGCVSVCPVMALREKERFPDCDQKKCTGCSICVKFCPAGALKLEGKK
jgi:Fe-S-cluster-containing hydrogenase component 2